MNRRALNKAMSKLNDTMLGFEVSKNTICMLGDKTSAICQSYEPELDELELAFLLEKRRKILTKLLLVQKQINDAE